MSEPVRCQCCDGKGVVVSMLGVPRPCSRCRADDFSAWSERRRRIDDLSEAIIDANREAISALARPATPENG